MRVKFKQIVEGILPLREIAKQVTKPQLSVALAQALREIEPQVEIYTNEEKKILERYWQSQNGSGYIVPADKREPFERDVNELKETEITLREVGRWKLQTLTENGATVSGDTLYKLGWMIKPGVDAEWDEPPGDETT